jgi:pSer/pThr/pTyr-binding forkhead associated (FHA) protein
MANKGWLSSLFGSRSERRFELVVLEGEQAGQCFPLRHDRMLIGRRAPDPNRPQEVYLSDRSVSLRQAILEIKRGRVFIEHVSDATNPTVVNRRRVNRTKLRAGDIIVLGLVVLELREIAEVPWSGPRPAASEITETLAATAESGLENRSRPAAGPQAEAETWLDGDSEAKTDEGATIAESTDAEPEPTPERTETDLDAGDLPEDERPTVVRSAPEDQAETIIAESTHAEPEPKP